ncbi:hypothetical protein MVEN_02492500 [Mycena venus]|uniref:Uncharacterized protein n=1 Tax=Mycena venus TaxID=2733690 RepID=A0A8H6WXY2_9AGAR|nr:hypothetical protein MVEN_02492500 [Mycena venus]
MEGWDALDPSAIQAIRHAEARDGASTSTASASMAPSVPDSVVEKGKKRTLNLQQKLQATIADPTMNPATALIDDAEEWKKSMADLESPLTSKARERTLANWAGFIGLVKPDLSTNDYWLRDIVKEQAVNFLYSLVKTTDPLPNKQSIKARTLTWWTGLFLYSIVTYTRDNRWKKCGITLLVTDGLYHEIKKAVIHLVHTFKLDRYADKRIYFNRFELGMIIDACLQASLHQPILEDLTILCLGPLQWEIIFRLRHFKTAITSAEGQEQTFHITGALRAHNALFDLTVVFMAHLWMLNAFKTKYATPQDLFNDTSAKLDLDPAMLHEPIFRKASQGGREFEHPPQAAMSRSFYDSFRYWAHQAGLPRAGVGALRRDTGNTYALQMGQKMAKDILNHHVLGVFRRSYSRNMENLRLVGVRLGEVSGTKETVPGEKLKENLERNMFTSYAVEALVRHRNVDPEESQDAVSERKAFKECLKNKGAQGPRTSPPIIVGKISFVL